MIFSIHRHEVLDSTNLTARRWIEEGAAEGAVVLAHRQIAGRGRDGRSWESLPGALLFSIILRPSTPASHLQRLGFIACVAGALAAEGEGIPFAPLKWPNDLVFPCPSVDIQASHLAETTLPWAKWGGILVETGAAGSAALWAVVGVGLNVGTLAGVPGEVRPPSSTSLSDTVGRAVDSEAFLRSYLEHFGSLYKDSQQGPDKAWDSVRQQWGSRDILLGRSVRATSDGKQVSGIARGINERGALRLETTEGMISVEVGDVHLEKFAPLA